MKALLFGALLGLMCLACWFGGRCSVQREVRALPLTTGYDPTEELELRARLERCDWERNVAINQLRRERRRR